MLERLKGVVTPDGTVTAGNASGVSDGAAVSLIASGHAVERLGLVPKARIVAMASAGVAPDAASASHGDPAISPTTLTRPVAPTVPTVSTVPERARHERARRFVRVPDR